MIIYKSTQRYLSLYFRFRALVDFSYYSKKNYYTNYRLLSDGLVLQPEKILLKSGMKLENKSGKKLMDLYFLRKILFLKTRSGNLSFFHFAVNLVLCFYI